MSNTWWPWRRQPDTSKKEAPNDEHLDETRQIVRRVIHDTQKIPMPEKRNLSRRRPPPTVSVLRGIGHVNFHRNDVIIPRFNRIEPVTKKMKKARRFNRSGVFYRKDGSLRDDDGPVWQG